MKLPLSAICALSVAAGVALTSTPAVLAAPLSVPGLPATFSDVVKVQDSAKIIRRDNSKGGDAWKKRAGRRGQLHRDGRREARVGQRRNHIYRPKAMPKYAYDAEGNFRVYDGRHPSRNHRWKHLHGHADRWSDRDRWEDWGQWDDRHRRRPHGSKMDSFGYQQPSPALKRVLTAIPEGQ